jgi:hypothetical protein
MRDDPALRWAAWEIAVRNNILTADEARQEEKPRKLRFERMVLVIESITYALSTTEKGANPSLSANNSFVYINILHRIHKHHK